MIAGATVSVPQRPAALDGAAYGSAAGTVLRSSDINLSIHRAVVVEPLTLRRSHVPIHALWTAHAHARSVLLANRPASRLRKSIAARLIRTPIDEYDMGAVAW